MNRGHFGIGFYSPKYTVNAGTLIRSANAFGAAYAFTIADRYDGQASAVGHDRHLPVHNHADVGAWLDALPYDTTPVCVELTPDATPLPRYHHPERAAYLLGPEDGDVPAELTGDHDTVRIPGEWCLNVATAGSIVLYDRVAKAGGRQAASVAPFKMPAD